MPSPQSEDHDGKGRSKGGSLGNPQCGSGRQRIVENRLKDAAGKPQPGPSQNGRTNSGQPVVLDHQVDPAVSRPAKDPLDDLRRRRLIGTGL